MSEITHSAVEIPSKPVDLSQIHPSLHKYYGDGMPLKTYRTSTGAIVRIWGACLPKTPEENHRNIQRAWQVADQICERAAIRYAQQTEKAADSSHPVSSPIESPCKDSLIE